jgi:RNA polymerase sigma-70 factor (ECF subfamily)
LPRLAIVNPATEVPANGARSRRSPATPLAELTDAGLALALRANDPGAAGEAVRRFTPLIVGLLRRLFRRHVEVEDAVQEAFLRFFTMVPRLREAMALRAFVVAIALRTAGRHARRARSRRRLAASAAELGYDHRSVADVMAPSALGRLGWLLARLDVDDRTVFVLRFVEGRRLHEIAKLVETSQSTVRRRCRRSSKLVRYLAARDLYLAEYVHRAGSEERDGAQEAPEESHAKSSALQVTNAACTTHLGGAVCLLR